MIRIVDKGYKYLLKQLSDFLGISKMTVISLKSNEGRKKYALKMESICKLRSEQLISIHY
jgi:hypothetical protein